MSHNSLGPITSARTVIEYGDSILLMQRSMGQELAGQWELPGGKIDADEDILSGALREVAEESGLLVEPLNYAPLLVDDRIIPDGKHKGRRYLGYGVVAKLSSHEPWRLKLSSENQACAWVDTANLFNGKFDLTRPSVKALYGLRQLLRSPAVIPSPRPAMSITVSKL